MSQPETLPTNPYVGPRAFVAGEQLFGRDQEVRDLTQMLIEKRIVLLFGPSGAGKTSFIQAGLIPAMQAEQFQVLPPLRLSLPLPPGLESYRNANRYVYSALLSLESSLDERERQSEQSLMQITLPEYLERNLGRLAATSDYMQQVSETSLVGNKAILIIEQFEELLTLSRTDRPKKIEFCQQLGKVLEDSRLWALFVLREDLLGALEPYLEYLPERLSHHFRLDLLTHQGALEAVIRPAEMAGVAFDQQAAGILVDQLSTVQEIQPDGSVVSVPGETIEPVQLQVVLRDIWQANRPDPGRITLEDMKQFGDVIQALAGYYADAVAAAARDSGVSERQIREWVESQLITPNGLRSQVLREAEATAGLDNRVIDSLEVNHLVRSEARRGMVWYELAHDRLLTPVRQDNARWFRLAQPIDIPSTAVDFKETVSFSPGDYSSPEIGRQSNLYPSTSPGDKEHFSVSPSGYSPEEEDELSYPYPTDSKITIETPGWRLVVGEGHPDWEKVYQAFQLAPQYVDHYPDTESVSILYESTIIAEDMPKDFLKQARDNDPVLVIAGTVQGIGRLTKPSISLSDRVLGKPYKFSVEPVIKFDPPIEIYLIDQRLQAQTKIADLDREARYLAALSAREFNSILELAYQIASPGMLGLGITELSAITPDGGSIYTGADLRLEVTLKNTGEATWARGTFLDAACSFRQDNRILSPTKNIDFELGVDLPPSSEWIAELSGLTAPALRRNTNVCELAVQINAKGYPVTTSLIQTVITVQPSRAGAEAEEAADTTPVIVYTKQSAALHSRPNVLSPKSLTVPANTPLQVLDADPVAALKRLGDPDQWLEVQAQVDGEQVRGFIEADLVSSEPQGKEVPQPPPPTALPQAWIVVANPKQYSWEANFSKITPDGPPVEVNWTHARGALAQAYIKRSRPGDIVLAYLSSAKKRAIIGLGEVAAEPQERDGWWSVRLRLVRRFNQDISFNNLKNNLPELEKVRVERASYSKVAPDLWPRLRSLIVIRNSALDPLLPSSLAGAEQPPLRLKLEPLNFPDVISLIETQVVPVSMHLTGDLRVTNTGEAELAGGEGAPPVSITAEWYRLDATAEEDARTSEILSYTPGEMIAPGQTTAWRKLIFKPPSQPGEYEVRLVVTDPERGLGEVSPPILTEVLDPRVPVSLSKLRTRIQELRRELRDSDEMGVPAVAAIDAILTQALEALSRTDTPAAQKHIEEAEARWKTWQSERTSRQEIENELQMLTKEANRALPPDLSVPFTTQVNALRERKNALAPLPEVQATLDNLQALYNALRDEYNRINQLLEGIDDPGMRKSTHDEVLARLAERAGQPYQKEMFDQMVADIDKVIQYARAGSRRFALKIEALNLPASAPAGAKLPLNLQLTNPGPTAWNGSTSILVTEHVSRRKARSISGLASPVEGVGPGGNMDIPLEVTLPLKPGITILSWVVELPEHVLQTETPRYTILVEEKTFDKDKVLPPAIPLEGLQQPQRVGATIGGISIYNAPVEYHYGQPGELAGGEPAREKITLTITPQNIELSYRGKDYLSPSAPLLNDLELKDPFRFKPADYGRKLFDCLISTERVNNINPPTRDGFTLARSQSEGGRLEIAIESRLSPDQGTFYWEYLTDDNGQPLATFESSPFYRQVGGDSGRDYPDANPLKILFAISSPQELAGTLGQGTLGLPAIAPADRLLPENPIRSTVRQLSPLDRKAEADTVHDGMNEAVAHGLATYELLGGPDDTTGVTWERVQQKVKLEDFHVLHLLAHGIQNPLTGHFNLVMETNDRHFSLVSSDDIDPKIADNTALRLVTLASCRSADPTVQLSRESHLSAQSFAERLIEAGIPAVIAMQDNMDIAAAQLLTRSFYEDLAYLGRIDTALASARRDLYTWQKDNRAWGIPVLLFKGGNPSLFHVDPERLADKNYRRSTTQEKIRDLKSYEERTGRKDPVEDRTLQEVEKLFNASGMGARPSLMFALQQTLASQLPVRPEAAIPLAEPQATRDLARRYCRKLAISTAALQDYVKNVHKDRLELPTSTYAHIASSLNAGKHIILTGPPGSAKTSLAMAISDFVSRQRFQRVFDQAGNLTYVAQPLAEADKFAPGYVMSTATSDWTTFDTVGGYMPDQSGALQFRLGIFLDAIRKGEWLVIDEINRAEIDKAFGPLFTVLSGQEVMLPYRVGGETVCVQPAITDEIERWDKDHPDVWVPAGVTDRDFTYVIHPNWRIIGTMNVYDKSSLFQMSLAFMRRFAFIDVELPDDPTYATLVERWWKEFVTDPHPAAVAASLPEDIRPLLQFILWQKTYPTMPAPVNSNPLMKRRAIGPAIVRDMIRYVGDRYNDFEPKDQAPMQAFLAEAFALYVTPQLDGLDFNGVRNIVWHFEQRLFADLLNGNDEQKLACNLILNKVKMLYPHIQSWDKPDQEDK